MRNVLQENNYPLRLIENVITQTKAKYQNSNQANTSQNFDLEKIIAIPYYRNTSEKIKQILSKFDIKVVFRKGLTIRSILNKQDKPITEKSNLVYNINCNDCDAVYVGTTKRKLKQRINEHKLALHKDYIKSNVADHAKLFKHSINFDEPKIAYFENKNSARKFLESFEIEKMKCKNNNLTNDQQNSKTYIPSVYLPFIKD